MMLDYLNFCLSGKFLNRSEYQTTLPVSWETCVQVKKHKLELEKEQTGLTLGNFQTLFLIHLKTVITGGGPKMAEE